MRAAALALVPLTLTLSAPRSSHSGHSSQAPQPVFKASAAELVRVDVSVTRDGQPVKGLSAADFTVTDNGVAQQITGTLVEQAPLSVMLVLDVSGSVAGDRLTHLIDAGHGLMSQLLPDDRAALITFAQDVALDVPLTRDREQMAVALANLHGQGMTALHDAVEVALRLTPEDDSRPVLLVFSDGRDTASWLTEERVFEAARRAGVVLHAVVIRQEAAGPMPKELSGLLPTEQKGFLDRLADTCGGRTWSAATSRDLGRLFARALDEMRARYLLTFTPSRHAAGWHQLKVTLKGSRGDLVARPGYFVSE